MIINIVATGLVLLFLNLFLRFQSNMAIRGGSCHLLVTNATVFNSLLLLLLVLYMLLLLVLYMLMMLYMLLMLMRMILLLMLYMLLLRFFYCLVVVVVRVLVQIVAPGGITFRDLKVQIIGGS